MIQSSILEMVSKSVAVLPALLNCSFPFPLFLNVPTLTMHVHDCSQPSCMAWAHFRPFTSKLTCLRWKHMFSQQFAHIRTLEPHVQFVLEINSKMTSC